MTATVTALKETSLDQRIADTLANPDQLTSSELAELLGEVATAIAISDRIANINRERAYDAATIDPSARGKMEDATFVAARLRNAQAALTPHHQAAVEREERARYTAEAGVIENKITELARELATTYPETVSRLVDLFQRIATADREAASFCNRSPPGHFVRGVEATIGGGEKIIENVRLPVLTAKGVENAWPPRSTWVTDYSESVRAGMQSVAPPTEADRAASAERVIAHARDMEAGRLRLNDELAARVRDNAEKIRQLTTGV
jgi:hypothetical protein